MWVLRAVLPVCSINQEKAVEEMLGQQLTTKDIKFTDTIMESPADEKRHKAAEKELSEIEHVEVKVKAVSTKLSACLCCLQRQVVSMCI